MKYNLLGHTGLKVSELCLGTMTFGGRGMWKAIGTMPQKEVDELVKKAVDGGINFIDTANVYSEGLSEEMTGKAFNIVDVMRGIADNKNVSVAQIALAWLLHQSVVTSVIIGAKKQQQLDDNLASVNVDFTDEELKKLDEVSRLAPEYPGWMLEHQTGSRKKE